jgi:heme A synthase
MPAVNDMLLGFLLYQSRLVPRALSLIGIVGAVSLVAGYIAVMFGLIGQHAPLAALSALLVALFEFSLGVWLVVKGFKPSPNLSSDTRDASAAAATNLSASRQR